VVDAVHFDDCHGVPVNTGGIFYLEEEVEDDSHAYLKI
jgi:hypothetical protein